MKSNLKTALLLLVPCLLLASLGYIFQAYEAGKKFAFTTSTVSLAPLKSAERQRGYDTKIVLVVNTKGERPKWITEPRLMGRGPAVGVSIETWVFYKHNGKKIEFQWPKGVKSTGVRTPFYNQSTRQYTYECLLNLNAVPKKLGPLTCEIKANLLYVTDVPRPIAMPYTSAKNTIVVRP